MKSKLNIAFLLMIILFSCNSNEEQNQNNSINKINDDSIIEYYSTIPLRESPYPSKQGVIRLTKEEAMERNHYQFTFDKNLKLKSISFYLGNELINPNHTSNYFFTTSQQKFEYIDNLEIRTFFDRFGNQRTQRRAFKEIYTLDSFGRYKSLSFEDKSGNQIENSWGISKYEWDIQNDGSVIEKRYNLKGEDKSLRPGFEFYTIRLYFEQNGFLALMQNIDKNGNLVENSSGVAQDKLHFDKDGRWLGWTVLDKNHQIKRGNGPNVAKGINIPDKYGYETSIRYEDIDGTTIINSHGFWGGKRYYDKFGNYDYTQFVDSLGNLGINERTGYATAKYTWSDDGLNRLSLQLLGLNNEPVLHKTRGYASYKNEYNQDGNIIKSSNLGLNNEPINSTGNGISFYTYKYDDNKKRIETKRFDKNGNELKKD